VNWVGTGCVECQKHTSNKHGTRLSDLLPAPEGMIAMFVIWKGMKKREQTE